VTEKTKDEKALLADQASVGDRLPTDREAGPRISFMSRPLVEHERNRWDKNFPARKPLKILETELESRARAARNAACDARNNLSPSAAFDMTRDPASRR
jgi:hypothetical protein